MMMNISADLAEHLECIQFNDLPHETIELEKKFIVDSLGVAIAGSSSPGCQEVLDVISNWDGKNEATILVHGNKVPSPFAALMNCMMMHALDFDETLDEAALHAHVTVLPAALAVAESIEGVTGRNLITSVVLGVDLVCRLGLAIRRPLSWIRTATCGSFGAAAAAAKILGLDREKIHNALGIVYSQTSGNAQCLIDGGLTKRMQPAFAAQAGVISALLAQKGITGARDVFEGDHGFFNLYERGEWDRTSLLDGLGKRFEGAKLSIKPYPCCRMTHAAIDAALEMAKQYKISPSIIERVIVYTSEMVKDMVGRPFEICRDPRVDAQFSIPYAVSLAFMRGGVFLKDFQESFIGDEGVLEMTKKVKVLIDPNIEKRDIMTANLVVMTKNKEYHQGVNKIKGNPSNPLSMDECIKKFMNCIIYSKSAFLERRVDEILHCLLNLEELRDVRILMGLLR